MARSRALKQRQRQFGEGKKSIKNFFEDIGMLPDILREGQKREKKDIEEFKKRQKK